MLTGIAFTQLPLWVLKDQNLSFAAKCVYALLQSRINRDNPELGAWPSIRTMATELGASVGTIANAVQELVDAGIVTRERRARENGHNSSNRYRLAVAPPGTPQVVGHVQSAEHAHVQHTERAHVQHTERAHVQHTEHPVQPAEHNELDLINQNKNSTHTPRARAKEPSSPITHPPVVRMPLIARGEAIAFDENQQKLHRPCHPEVCRWRSAAVRKCMPAVLVDEFAANLVLSGMARDTAVADVIRWAREDAPPAGYVAPGDAYAHWRARWTATRASTPQPPGKAEKPRAARVPDAEETRRRYIEPLLREAARG